MNKEIKNIIAPAALEINSNYLKFGEKVAKTLFIFAYPRYLSTGWFSPIINMPGLLDISIFINPVETPLALKNLRKKSAQLQAQISEEEEKGLVRNPVLETALQDIENLRDSLQQAQEHLFSVGAYITIYGNDANSLTKAEEEIKTLLESRLIYTKTAVFQQLEGFSSVLPIGRDKLNITSPLNSSPASSFFPFVSVNLTSEEGIMYGINRHNNTLIIFDRFSLENSNMVIFAKSGSGKSILGSEPVPIRKNGEVRLEKIGPLVEEEIRERGLTKIDEELEGVIDPGIEVYSFDKNLKGSWSKVSVAARKLAPKMFYKFITKSGRRVTTTGDHNMLVLREGKIMVVKSSEVKIGESVPLPRSLPQPEQPLESINLLDLLKNSKNIYIKGAARLIQENYQALKNAQLDSRLDQYLYKYKTDRVIPIEYFHKIIEFLKINPDTKSLNQLKITSKSGRAFLPLLFSLSESFAKILGYIASEGTVTENVVMISNEDKKLIQDIEKSFREIQIPFFYADRAIVSASRVFVELIRALEGAGKAGQKKVSPIVFNLRKEQIAAYLRAYFDGDGGVEKGGIIASSKSLKLISGLSYLLYYFGIITRIKEIRKKAQGWKHKKLYYRLTICGQENLEKFSKNISFISKRKKGKLKAITTASGNTNVDVIPEVKGIIREIYQALAPQLRNMPEMSLLSRGVHCPSPAHLKKVITKIEKRINLLKDSAPIFDQLADLPSLNYLINAGKNSKQVNRTFWQVLNKSWPLIRSKSVKPRLKNVLKATEVISGNSYSSLELKKSIHQGFKDLGLSIKHFNRSLQSALKVRPEANTDYGMIYNAAQFLAENYQNSRETKLPQVEERLEQLKKLAEADLFWDPIEKIEAIENTKEKYVYDLTVDNEIFLAGTAGMFVHNSYATKLEALRLLMMGVDVLIIDPENEYEKLAEAIGGSFFRISLTSGHHINPFDVPIVPKGEDPADVLRSHIINLSGLLKIMLGEMTVREESLLDRALTETYASREIVPGKDFSKAQAPVLQDLEEVLGSMEGGKGLADRLYKYTKGSYAGFMNNPSNVDIKNRFIVFSIRDLEEELRPIAMYIVLNYIWNLIRADLKKRIMIIDEAWWMVKHEDGASFLFSLVKRARKYFLGVTTITQDVEDFLRSPYGRPIITNSSLQILLKQAPAMIDMLAKTFNLTEREKNMLLEVDVGQGLFFAGLNRAAIQVVASYLEDKIITTKPEQLLEERS